MKTTTVRRLRWGVPFVAGAAVAAAAILPGVAAGSDHPSLPARSATQLLTDLLSVKPPALSGTVVETARLGLPELPSTGASAAELSWQNLVTGSHTARVWLDGPDRQRVALVGDLAESDVVHNGTAMWIYSSSANQATHIAVPAALTGSAQKSVEAKTLLTPAQAAAQALAAITPTTRVSVDDTARVAGRAAYQIVLAPRDARSLVTSVTIALDSQTYVPLRVRVYGRDLTTPALETTFTDITFARPPASVFAFIPPTGATVTQSTLGQALSGRLSPAGTFRTSTGHLVPPTGSTPSTDGKGAGTRTIGSGWTAVLVTDGTALTGLGAGSGSGQLTGLLLRSATRVAHGRLITTALLSFLLTDDGRLYVGAVDGAALQKVASTGQPL